MTHSLSDSLNGISPLKWATDFLFALGVKLTLSNLQVVYSWEFEESGGGGGMYNPLNTTQDGYPGETNYNVEGVKNYVTYSDGISATVRVMQDEAYKVIRFTLEIANNAQDVVDAITLSIWGTKHIQLRDLPQPIMKERDMVIQSGKKSTVLGQTPYYTPAIDGQHIECWYGARLLNDQPTSNPNLFLWHPINLDPNVFITGLTRRINDLNDPASGGEKRPGILVSDSSGQSHNGFGQ